jgi:hypothetical protein
MAKVVFGIEEVAVFQEQAIEFLGSPTFTSFMSWMDEAVKENESALLSENPANHVYDLPDGTMDLAVGDRHVDLKRQQQRAQAGGLFAFPVVKAGSFTEVLSFLGDMTGEAQLEAAMAFYVASTREFLSSCKQWHYLAQKFGWNMPRNLDNPFYREVCKAILRVFQERGWI